MPFNYTCEQCGKTFARHCRPGPNNPNRYCSMACRHFPRTIADVGDGTARVDLGREKVAIIDIEDIGLAKGYNWCLSGGGYAIRKRTSQDEPGGPSVFLHRVVVHAPPNIGVDHINGDKLDDRRRNLRHATQKQNVWNTGPRKRGTSRFKGVSWHATNSSWTAQIRSRGRNITRSGFESEEAAAKAYDDLAREHFGEFARLNFPD
jgi:hypothetical protein